MLAKVASQVGPLPGVVELSHGSVGTPVMSQAAFTASTTGLPAPYKSCVVVCFKAWVHGGFGHVRKVDVMLRLLLRLAVTALSGARSLPALRACARVRTFAAWRVAMRASK